MFGFCLLHDLASISGDSFVLQSVIFLPGCHVRFFLDVDVDVIASSYLTVVSVISYSAL